MTTPAPRAHGFAWQLFAPSAVRISQLRATVTHNRNLVCYLINQWHSSHRAPQGWRVAFLLTDDLHIYGVATWGRPVARLEDQIMTLEHTRMALSPDAPRNSGTRFMALMRAWIRANLPEVTRVISYVPTALQSGIVYRGDNWRTVYANKPNSHKWQNRAGRAPDTTGFKTKFEREP